PKVARYILYKKGAEVVIESPEPVNYAIDGEMGASKRIAIKVEPKAMRFIVPKGLKKGANA
ncbi:MAG: hypothetical protein WBJ70_05710, partial [Bacilli bacterium]